MLRIPGSGIVMLTFIERFFIRCRQSRHPGNGRRTGIHLVHPNSQIGNGYQTVTDFRDTRDTFRVGERDLVGLQGR